MKRISNNLFEFRRRQLYTFCEIIIFTSICRTISFSQCYSYKCKCDNLNNKQIKFLSNHIFNINLKKLEIKINLKSKILNAKMQQNLKNNNNQFVKSNIKEILNLVLLKQKLLSLFSVKYGMYHTKTSSLANNYICSLDFRVYVILQLFNNFNCEYLNIDDQMLECINLPVWVNFLSYTNVFEKYKIFSIKKLRIFILNKKQRLLINSTILNSLIQLLYVLTYEPIIEPFSDYYSFGFRYNRNAHQAIGQLASILYSKYNNYTGFNSYDYIFKCNIFKFFNFTNCNWLNSNFPLHFKHKKLLNYWLNSKILFYDNFNNNKKNFLQGNVISPLLINFTLNGLEEIIKLKKVWLTKMYNFKYKNIQFIYTNIIVRFLNNFIMYGMRRHQKNFSEFFRFKFIYKKKESQFWTWGYFFLIFNIILIMSRILRKKIISIW